MPFNDEELTALEMQKKTALGYKQACKREVDSAKAYLDGFDARIDGAWSKAERRSLIDAKRTAKADFFQKLAELREANAQLTSANERFQRRLGELREQSAHRRPNRAFRVARDVYIAGQLAFNVHAAVNEPLQDSGRVQEKWGDTHLEQQKEDTSRQLESGTTDQGNKRTWTSQDQPKQEPKQGT